MHPRRSASKTIRPAAARGGSGRSVGPFDRWRIGALLVLTLVALAGALNLENLRRLNHDLRGLAHAHEVIDALEGARLHLHEAEATQRGFLLMGDPQLLWRLRESVDAALGRLDHARTLTVAEPQLQAGLAELVPRIERLRAQWESAISLRESQGAGAGSRVFAEARGSRLLEEVDLELRRLHAVEREQLSLRLDESDRGYAFALLVGILTSLAAVGALAGFVWLLGRHLGARAAAVRRLAERGERLRDSELRARQRADELEAVMRAVPAVVWIAHDPRCERITGNPASYDLLRLPQQSNASLSAIGHRPRNFRVLQDGVELASHELPVQRAAAGEEVRDFEEEVVFDDGQRVVLFGHAVPLRDDHGRVRGSVAAFIDITERKRAEQRRQRTEAELRFQLELTRSITDNAATAIFMTDDASRCTFMNPAAERMTGFRFDEVEGKVLHDFIHCRRPDGRPYPPGECPIQRALPDDADVVGHEDVFVRKDGRMFPVVVNAKPIREQGGAVGTVIEARDVTREKEALHALQQLSAQLSEADRRKDEFLAMLAHELRNPLASISNGLHVLRLAADDPPSSQAAAVGRTRAMMERQLAQLVRLVDDLLDVSRITTGKIELRCEPVLLSAVLDGALDACQPLLEQMRHRVESRFPDRPVALHADPMRLSQVFANLLHNAAKYSEPGSVIEITAQGAGGEAVVSIRDRGVGIDPEKLPQIFELFAQLDESLERTRGGLGIGLTLVRRLVEMHGGRVEARSDGPGRGAEFIVRLPSAEPAKSPAPPTRRPGEPARERASLKILIADDNRDAADSLAAVVTAQGHRVQVAYDGRSAVQVAGRWRPDVLLLDIGMPGTSGYEACGRIREQPWSRDATMIAVTGWGQEQDRQRSMRAGFDHHLVKPVDFARLCDLLDRVAIGRFDARSARREEQAWMRPD